MSEHLSVVRVKQLVTNLFAGIAQRANAEIWLQRQHEQDVATERQRAVAATQQRIDRFESEQSAIQSEYDDECSQIGEHFRAHYSAASEEFDEARRAVTGEHDSRMAAARHELEETGWMVASYFDESSSGALKQQFEQFEQNVEATRLHLDTEWTAITQVKSDCEGLLKKRRMWSEVESPRASAALPSPTLDALVEQFGQLASQIRSHAVEVARQSLPMLFNGALPVLVLLVGTAALMVTGYFVIGPTWLNFKTHEWLVILGAGSVLLTVLAQWILYSLVRSAAERDIERLQQLAVDADQARTQWGKLVQQEHKRRRKEFDEWQKKIVKERDLALKKAQETFDRVSREAAEKKTQGLKLANERYPKLMDSLTKDRDQKLGAKHADYPERLKKLQARFDWDLDRLQKERERTQDQLRQRFDIDWQSMTQNWLSSVDAVTTSIDRLHAESAPVSRKWVDLAFGSWTRPVRIPATLRLGQFQFGLSDIQCGMPADDRLIPATTQFVLPALQSFPNQTSLLVRANGPQGREAAVKLLQVAMLRLLTTLPPGKIRFTIIDPIGLGQNFSAFMHLVDYDELLVTKRIWTEASHIEQRLTDLTEHMETIFQTYLRNEFKSIEEYNEFAGEVAEPYHILVIAGFPANFAEQAGRRLTSILTSGPKCGVYTLISVDGELQLPPNFRIEDIASNATGLYWNGEHFFYDDPELQWLPLRIDELPEPDAYSRIVKNIGDASKDARRVEVSFERVVPKELWENDSRGGLDVPLGRAGATKLQHMRLGKGTSQHVLVAGKTGSGKSTLMHILVTNLALHYSPNEIEFYLIDFKKGVEFKTYASHRLPHARVIAIESDREFGMSVLERLDAILKERGDLFRDQGVQDIAGYRNANPGVRMPRMLLLVDEFQEFFIEEDKLSQQSALLLDRLVRQGRAFGMHVLLGSQTLGGAYSLARSTLGQVAVRIALQCSEADAHLILSEENTAARLLTRPGEAIYNDANGMLEGNHPFQIAWLEDERRDFYLKKISELTVERDLDVDPPIVFEGNIPANPLNNREIRSLFEGDAPTTMPKLIDAWLGEAVAIKPHTTARFRRLSGSNMLIVGQSAPAARGIMSSVVIAAALQMPAIVPFDAIVVDDGETSDEGETFDGPTNAASTRSEISDFKSEISDQRSQIAPAAPIEPSPQNALEALKSFSFSNFKLSSSGESNSAALSTDEPDSPPAQFYILDGDLADNPDLDFWGEITGALPHDIRIGGPRDATRVLKELTDVMLSRVTADSEPPIFLVIDNLGRFRDLRKADDDYSFGGSGKQSSSPAKQFVDLLKEGPTVGIHAIVWCDSFNNLGRWLSNQSVRELEMRVAFQMSSADSSNLIDSPSAGKLGTNRALLFLEEQGTLEKFRPYGLPSDELRTALQQRYAQEIEAPANPDDNLEVCDDLDSFTIV